MATNIEQHPEETTTVEQQRRQRAIKRVQEKNGFKAHLVVYLLVNAMLVVVWVVVGRGFFWPIFVMGFWGIGLIMNGYAAYRGDVVTEEQIEREMKTLP